MAVITPFELPLQERNIRSRGKYFLIAIKSKLYQHEISFILISVKCLRGYYAHFHELIKYI